MTAVSVWMPTYDRTAITSWLRVRYDVATKTSMGVPKSYTQTSFFLLRDAMHKRGLCRRAVSVCLSVCVSVCPTRSRTLWKRVSISSEFLLRSGRLIVLVFSYQNVVAIFNGGPHNLGKNRDLRQNIWLWHRSQLDRRMLSAFRLWGIIALMCRPSPRSTNAAAGPRSLCG